MREHDEAVDPAKCRAPELRMFLAEEPLDRHGGSVRLLANTSNRPTILEPFPVPTGDTTLVSLRFDHHDAARPQHHVVDIPTSSGENHIIDEDVVVRQPAQELSDLPLSLRPTLDTRKLPINRACQT